MAYLKFTRKRIRGKITRIGVKPTSMPSKKEVVNKFKPKEIESSAKDAVPIEMGVSVAPNI